MVRKKGQGCAELVGERAGKYPFTWQKLPYGNEVLILFYGFLAWRSGACGRLIDEGEGE